MEEQQVLPGDHLQLLFSNLEQMLEIHSQFNNLMKSKKKEGPIVGEIADLLLTMFDGPEGEEFQEAAATFCARQQIALELLKERRRKDAKLNNFLTEVEGNPLCRRLQLKDIIPTGMQSVIYFCDEEKKVHGTIPVDCATKQAAATTGKLECFIKKMTQRSITAETGTKVTPGKKRKPSKRNI
ncbi:hypothetical protein PR048_031494 [Dryococelus australis]|uniref:DH domain-containing protein n=1 Tax=Dryococelus australis TaxID=614101 RepID=A0ABQ9G9H3_9NEOP|nr:hypothetical protein PR048_031494 [Dryococelus australis]